MLGDKLKELRRDAGMTQEELAVRLNVVRQTVSKWEKNLSVPDADILNRICEIFEADIKEVVSGENKEHKSSNEDKKRSKCRILGKCVLLGVLIIVLLGLLQMLFGTTVHVEENTQTVITE